MILVVHYQLNAIPMDEIRIGIKFRNLNGLYYTETHLPDNKSVEPGTGLWPLSGSNFYTSDPLTMPGQLPLTYFECNWNIFRCQIIYN